MITQQNIDEIIYTIEQVQALFQELVPVAFELEKTATRGIARKELAVAKRVLSQMHQNLRS